MSLFFKDADPVFQGAGTNAGLEIWCIESLRVVPVPKSSHGKFYSGSAYIVLNTTVRKCGIPRHEVHYWVGENANKVDSALASDKALELDAALGSCTVQYREVGGQETEKFLSYFKPCIIPLEGVYCPQPQHLKDKTYRIRLLTCKGDRAVHVKEVPFSRSSLNHNDVFILDTASKVFLFSGCFSTIQERAKALDVAQYIKENNHSGSCDLVTIDDGKFVGDSDVGEFWSFFGGYAPIPRDVPSDQKSTDSSIILFWINTQGKFYQKGSDVLNKEMLETDKCYMLDCDSQIFVWMGKHTSVTERKTSIVAAEDFVRKQDRSTGTHLTFLTEGLETTAFKVCFEDWPKTVEPKLYEEGRGKVAAIFKQHGYAVNEISEQDFKPCINMQGRIKVWRVDGDRITVLPEAEQKKLFTGDCYIMQYTYPGRGRDENILYSWLGRRSVMEDRREAISHLNTIDNLTKGGSVVAQVVQDKEPDLFFFIFETLIIFKGGKSTQYKKHLEEEGTDDNTYDESKNALFRIQGTGLNNMQAIQVDLVSDSLNSSYCYVLQTGTCIFAWIGSLSSTRDHEILDRMMERINPTWQPVSVREGSEPDLFWEALGGKSEYQKGKEAKGPIEDPQLFVLNISEGDFKVKEIYNFAQDDLTTEDVLVLNCHNEIYLWLGCLSNVEGKEQALDLAHKFLEKHASDEGISLETPIYVVTEGQEPPLFTQFFQWDISKENMHGNSFERKLAVLKGKLQNLDSPVRKSWRSLSRETTPDGSRRSSLSPYQNDRSLSPAFRSSGPHLNSPNRNRFSSSSPTVRKLDLTSPRSAGKGRELDLTSPRSAGKGGELDLTSPRSAGKGRELDLTSPRSAGFERTGSLSPLSTKSSDIFQNNENVDAENLSTYPYERLTVASKDPIRDIDVTKREAYLSEEEFEEKFGMPKTVFYKLAKWKQNKFKMTLDLF
ncbi:villin-1 isoform X1 [Cucurbita moschata]|uniref:Villin-1 isoform X1 n=1 Tax=Cucurbita moschata TaxID=3662 RepID=A0A6J1G8S8_CUCMO|nr:villin-1 isoform X1 [Cucurbita moschata]XP_022948222.1 villin-1 isoform X1 [Cucurbita moschata]XP_022948223.1 villin-1 isoform X1 [Cucurbita moschata]